MNRLHSALSCALLAALVVLVGLCVRCVFLVNATIEVLPGQVAIVRGLIFDHVSRVIDGDLSSPSPQDRLSLRAAVLAEIEKQATGVRRDAVAQVAALRGDLVTQVSESRKVADRRLGDSLDRADAAIRTMADLEKDLRPVLTNAADAERSIGTMADTYRALPADLGTTLRPSFLALEPEITCRHADGTGYGGCWHGRITGLFGEFSSIGGTFTQKFPALSDAWVGISVDAHSWTSKYVAVHPMHVGDYFKAAGKITLGVGTAALHGGVF